MAEGSVMSIYWTVILTTADNFRQQLFQFYRNHWQRSFAWCALSSSIVVTVLGKFNKRSELSLWRWRRRVTQINWVYQLHCWSVTRIFKRISSSAVSKNSCTLKDWKVLYPRSDWRSSFGNDKWGKKLKRSEKSFASSFPLICNCNESENPITEIDVNLVNACPSEAHSQQYKIKVYHQNFPTLSLRITEGNYARIKWKVWIKSSIPKRVRESFPRNFPKGCESVG